MPNMRKLIAAGFAVSAMMLSPASAADLMVKAKPVPIYDWTGFYAGVNVGYGWADRDLSFSPNDDATRLWSAFNGIPPPTSFNTSGALGGLQFGYNRQLGAGWLVGLEADFAWSGIKGSGISSGALPPVPIPGPYSAPFDERIDWFGTVRARLGYLPTSTLLTYVTGGLAYGQVTRSGSYINNSTVGFTANGLPDNSGFTCASGATCFSGVSRDVTAGWTVGGGFEYALGERITLKAEYLYVSLAGTKITERALAVFVPGDTPASISANVGRANFNTARVGLNYRF